jgi:chorismate mutase
MSRDTKSHQRIQAIDERLARLRAERIRLAARVSRAERKRDTRRKILIGAAVLAAIDHEGVPVLRSQSDLMRWLDARLTRPHDRAVFDLVRRVGGGSSER